MTCLHQYIHAEEQASLKFTPITAKSPAPLTFREPHSMFEETRKKENPSIPPLCTRISKSWTHHMRSETRNATRRSAMTLPSPGSCPWPPLTSCCGTDASLSPCTFPIHLLPSKSTGKVTSPQLEGKRCHVEVCQAWSQRKVTYCCTPS